MDIILTSASVLGGLGLIFGTGLTYISYKFSIEINPHIEEIFEALPNANCGACGFAGCAMYAEKLAKGEASSPGLCVAGGEDAAKKIAKILGLEKIDLQIPKIAVVICGGGVKEAIKQFFYDGISTCKGANLLEQGNKACKYGCLGFGDCVLVCPFDAIYIGENGLPIINKNCTGCGKCLKECPKKVIILVDIKHKVNILCNSNDKGIIVRKICTNGCIACMRCIKACPKQAIEFDNFLAKINYPKCDNCGECIKVCPTKTIVSNNSVNLSNNYIIS